MFKLIRKALVKIKYLPHLMKMSMAEMGHPLTKNDQKLNALSGIHSGKRAVIIGMGPSLRKEDLESLPDDVVTFACNKIFLLFDETDWRPDYFSVIDVVVAENNDSEILTADFGKCQPIHHYGTRHWLNAQKDVLMYGYRGSLHNPLSPVPNRVGGGLLAGGCTVTIDMIQMAHLMGCTEIYLIGLDFSFKVPNTSTGENSGSGQILLAQSEQNHFHPNYRKPGEKWTSPRLDRQEIAFARLRELLIQNGVKLFNASRETKLEVIERVSLDKLLDS